MPAVAQNALASAAELYAALGWQVIPLHSVSITDGGAKCSCGRDCGNSRGKHPRLNEWQKHATDDVDQVRRWWESWPRSNVGVRLGSGSGIVGIDIDPPLGEEVLRAVSNDDLPATLTMRTGKGRRLLYAIPEQLEVEPKTVAFQDPGGGESIRLQGGATGAQCVMPPSMHYLGHRYEWVQGLGPSDVAPAVMPSWLIAEMCKPERPPSADTRPRDDSAPWTDFNRRANWNEWLTHWGFKPAGGRGDVRYYTRPGKSGGVSVSVGHYHGPDGTPALYVFSGSIPDLPAGKSYDLFGAYARMEFNGDFGAAAKHLVALKFGVKQVDRVAALERRVTELERIIRGRNG